MSAPRLALLLLLLLLAASAARAVSPVDDLLWWQTSVIYQIYPRSFKDSDGDGVGDIKGITSKLNYVKGLGVGAIWLSPVYKSPMVDMGYDISDFYDIDPLFGTMDDFKELLDAAHALDLKVVMDFVVSYTSDQIEWFSKSVRREEGYDDWYVWARGDRNDSAPNGYNYPSNWLSAFNGPAWEWSDERQEFYFHSFTKEQPDLNYRSQAVIEEMDRVLRFWFDLGVDGFRVDAVPQMAEDACFRDEEPAGNDLPPYDYEYLTHKYTQHQPETYATIKHWRQLTDTYDNPPRVLMLETYGPIDEVVTYYGTTEHPGGHFPFNFYFITELTNTSSAHDLQRIVHKWMDNTKNIDWPNWVLGNHDQRRVATRFGSQLVDAMHILALLLPGTAVTFMGEELGMEDHLGITWEETRDPWALNAGPQEYMVYSRDPERTPFQWDGTVSAGFSTNPETWLPVNPNYVWLNAYNQQHMRLTHVLIYTSLVRLRQYEAFQRGALATAVHGDGDVFVFSRVYGDEAYVMAINLGDSAHTMDLSAMSPLPKLTVSVSSITSYTNYVTFPADKVVLGPYGAVALRSHD